jgi:hypothetical protein
LKNDHIHSKKTKKKGEKASMVTKVEYIDLVVVEWMW